MEVPSADGAIKFSSRWRHHHTHEGWLYLAVAWDKFSRQMIGWIIEL